MEPLYRQSFTLTDHFLDCFGRLKPSAMLYLIQEMAGSHAAALGAGWEVLAGKNLFWALSRHKIEITRLPEVGETITLETWPMPTTRVAYPRATVAYDDDGNELFRSVALWVLMDIQSRAMVLPGKSGVIVRGVLRGTELDTPASILPTALTQVTARSVGYTLLDRNGHMNNTYYLDWIDDLLPSAFHQAHPLQALTLCYLNEAREGQVIDLHHAMDDSGCLTVEAVRQDAEDAEKGHRIFAARLRF